MTIKQEALRASESATAAKRRREGDETSDKKGEVHRRPYFSDGIWLLLTFTRLRKRIRE